MRLTTLIFLVLCIGAPQAMAQDPPTAPAASQTDHPYVAGGVSMVMVGKGEQGWPYLSGVLGGNVAAVHVAAGVTGQGLGFGGELSVSGEVSAAQEDRVFSYVTHHRDVLLSVLMHLSPRERFSMFEPVVGATFGLGKERYTNRFELPRLTAFPGAPLGDASQLRRYVGVTGGLTVWAPVGQHLQVGGSTRFTWFGRRTYASGPTGLGANVISLGVVLRVE